MFKFLFQFERKGSYVLVITEGMGVDIRISNILQIKIKTCKIKFQGNHQKINQIKKWHGRKEQEKYKNVNII